MARLPRLAVAARAHLVLLCGHAGRPVVRDDDDRRQFVCALRDAAVEPRVTVYAWALLDDQVWLLAVPPEAAALGRWVQAIGRRYVAGFNRRHGSAGTLWAGRFRATVVQPGELELQATLAVDLRPVRSGVVAAAEDFAWSSARHHLGIARDPVVGVGETYWALGNTPFEREAAYRKALDDGLSESQWLRLEESTRKGWALGDAAFLAELGRQVDRPLAPRARGRKGKAAA